MKKRFEELSKGEQEKVEAEYHNMDPKEFDTMMKKASRHIPNVKSTSKSAKRRMQKRTRLKPQASR